MPISLKKLSATFFGYLVNGNKKEKKLAIDGRYNTALARDKKIYDTAKAEIVKAEAVAKKAEEVLKQREEASKRAIAAVANKAVEDAKKAEAVAKKAEAAAKKAEAVAKQRDEASKRDIMKMQVALTLKTQALMFKVALHNERQKKQHPGVVKNDSKQQLKNRLSKNNAMAAVQID